MSWWVYLEDHTAEPWCGYGKSAEEFTPDYEGDEPCEKPCYPSVPVERHEEGGTYAIGGTSTAEVNITYNYSLHYYAHLNAEEGLRWLDGKRAADTIRAMEDALIALGTKQSADYWEATPGNAGYALSILWRWANQHPEAIWRVS